MTSTKKGKAVNATKEGPKLKVLNRPPTRTIVRWNDELDKKLLLAIQSACNKHGVRVPWGEVANMMQNNITDGAIVQHLAKLRTRMVEAGMEVPPPLRRAAGSLPKSPEVVEDLPAPNPVAGGKTNFRKKGAKRSLYDSGDESFDDGKKSNKKSNKKSKAIKEKDNSDNDKGKTKNISIKSEDETEDSGVYGLQVSETESVNEKADQDFVATGEEYANFKYAKSASVGTPSGSEPSNQGEPGFIHEASNDENAAIPIQNSPEEVAVLQYLGNTGQHAIQPGEIQAPSATEAVMNGLQGVPMGIDQAVPPEFTPHHNLHDFTTPPPWLEDPTDGNRLEMPAQFELRDFGFIHGATDQNVAFVRGFQPSSARDQFQHGSYAHIPFIPMHSGVMGSVPMSPFPMRSVPMDFMNSGTALAPSTMGAQRGLPDPDFGLSFDSGDRNPNCFDELVQQLSN
ncbi:hypothetical protein MaudCBS49596_001405 [Microsporum audouinii]